MAAGHVVKQPTLLYQGRQLGRTRFVLTEDPAAADWTTLHAEIAHLDGRAVGIDDLAEALATLRPGVHNITIDSTHAHTEFEIDLAVAAPGDITGVEAALATLIESQQLSRSAIQHFLQASASFTTARRYAAGISDYLWGVLAKERSPDSELAYDKYRDRYDRAATELAGIHRAVSHTITDLIAFHYNHLDTVRSGRVAHASRTLRNYLTGNTPTATRSISPAEPDPIRAVPTRAELDGILSDAHTEQVLKWCTNDLDADAGDSARAIEVSLTGYEPVDQLKLRVLLAQHYLRAGRRARAQRHARELRHIPLTADWANALLDMPGDGAPYAT